MKTKILSAFLLLMFFFFSFGQIGRISIMNGEINIYIYELLLIVTLGILFLKFHFLPLIAAYDRFKIIFWSVGVFLFSYCISIFSYTPLQNLVAFMYFVRLMIYIIYAVYLSYLLKHNKKFYSVISYGFILFIILTATLSIVQYFFYPDLRNLIYLGWDPHLNRLFGVFFDTSVSGAIYGLIFFLILSFKKQFINNKMIRYILLFTFGLLLVLTFSRNGYIGFVLTLVLYFLQNRKVLFILFGIVFFITLIFIVPKQFGVGVGLNRTFSINSRIVDIKKGITMWSKNPILGIGYNHIRYEREKNGAQNIVAHSGASFSSSYIIILVTGGLIGAFLFILSLLKVGMTNTQTQVLFLFIGILSFSDNILLHPFILFLFGSATALAFNYPSGKSRL